jgi:catechol 2,3-dioxygenase-like lactoylglutathione lyase family enzyme
LKGPCIFTRIHSATIIVAEQGAAADFYVNELGWAKRLDNTVGPNYRFVTVAPVGGDAELALNPPHIAGREPDGDTGISLSVADIEETYRTLIAQSVTFTKPLEAIPWGPKATWLQDPDSNTFFFVEA